MLRDGLKTQSHLLDEVSERVMGMDELISHYKSHILDDHKRYSRIKAGKFLLPDHCKQGKSYFIFFNKNKNYRNIYYLTPLFHKFISTRSKSKRS